jgi:hypothetical protein
MSKEDVFLIRAALEFYRERSERAVKKAVHSEIVNFYRKEIFRVDELLTKLEIL